MMPGNLRTRATAFLTPHFDLLIEPLQAWAVVGCYQRGLRQHRAQHHQRAARWCQWRQLSVFPILHAHPWKHVLGQITAPAPVRRADRSSPPAGGSLWPDSAVTAPLCEAGARLRMTFNPQVCPIFPMGSASHELQPAWDLSTPEVLSRSLPPIVGHETFISSPFRGSV